jgi:hypothetical protein
LERLPLRIFAGNLSKTLLLMTLPRGSISSSFNIPPNASRSSQKLSSICPTRSSVTRSSIRVIAVLCIDGIIFQINFMSAEYSQSLKECGGDVVWNNSRRSQYIPKHWSARHRAVKNQIKKSKNQIKTRITLLEMESLLVCSRAICSKNHAPTPSSSSPKSRFREVADLLPAIPHGQDLSDDLVMRRSFPCF